MYKILIAEDDTTSALILERTLEKKGYSVAVAPNGMEALAALKRERFDVILTDWMMPKMDGIELIHRVRAEFSTPPLIMVITVLTSASARDHALSAGADDYLGKPYHPREVLSHLETLISRRDQSVSNHQDPTVAAVQESPPFIGICIAASTGGPEAVSNVLKQLALPHEAALFIALHGPAWMFESFVERLNRATSSTVLLAADGVRVAPAHIYVAPGDRHLVIESSPPTLRLRDTPPENYVRPAADPLFRSVAEVFGSQSIAVVLTGMGRDGKAGASVIASAGGVVIVQDPKTAVSPYMPKSVIASGDAQEVLPLTEIPNRILHHIERKAIKLKV